MTVDTAGNEQSHGIHHYPHYTTATYTGLPLDGFVREDQTTTRQRLSTSTGVDSTWRQRIVKTNHNTSVIAATKFGPATSVEDQGDTAVTGDETCATTTYAINTDAYIGTLLKLWYALPAHVNNYASLWATPSNQDGQTVTLYDGAASEARGDAPSRIEGGPYAMHQFMI